MATVQVREVPDDVHLILRRRALEAGQSLQEYLLAELVAGARSLTPGEVAATAGRDARRREADDDQTPASAAFLRVLRDGG